MTPCIDCEKPLVPNKRRKSGRCKSCSARATARCPEKRAKARASMLARLSCPMERHRHLTRCHDGLREHLKVPENYAALQERGRIVGLSKAGNNEAWYAGRAASGRKRHNTVMAWCPIEYRATYRQFVDHKHIHARKAKAMILDMIAVDTRRYLQSGQLQQAQRSC